LIAAVSDTAKIIAAKSPLAVKVGKRAVRQQVGMNLSDAYECASRAMAENMMAADAEEGIAAFFGKREPLWRS